MRPDLETTALAKKPNYDFEKRKRELEKKRKKEEKQQRRRENSDSTDGEAATEQADGATPSEE